MGYYQGDYYQGSYYQGGIPLIGGLLTKLIPKAVKAVGGLVRGGARTIQRNPIGSTTTIGAAAYTLGAGRGRAAAEQEMRKKGRRMNVTNVKALRKAGRRVRGFLKLARRFGAMPITPKGKKLFKARRRAR